MWTKNQSNIVLCERNLIKKFKYCNKKNWQKKTHPYFHMESKDGF